jgi:predicted DNA binding CopG/RHH family protein
MEKSSEKKTYINTTVNSELLRSIRILAAEEGVRLNRLLDEALRDLLRKHGKKPPE